MPLSPVQRKDLRIGRTRHDDADEVCRVSLQPPRLGRGFLVELYKPLLEGFGSREVGDTITRVRSRDGELQLFRLAGGEGLRRLRRPRNRDRLAADFVFVMEHDIDLE